MTLTIEAPHITPREKEILNLLSIGKTSEEMAIIFGGASSTVDFHKKALREKFNVYKDTALVAAALRLHIIE